MKISKKAFKMDLKARKGKTFEGNFSLLNEKDHLYGEIMKKFFKE